MTKGTSLGTPLRNPQQAVPAPPAGTPGSDQIYKVAVGDAPQKGSAEAKVTIVEWSDFQCPYCARVVQTLQQILETYKDDVRDRKSHMQVTRKADAPYAAKASTAAD